MNDGYSNEEIAELAVCAMELLSYVKSDYTGSNGKDLTENGLIAKSEAALKPFLPEVVK